MIAYIYNIDTRILLTVMEYTTEQELQDYCLKSVDADTEAVTHSPAFNAESGLIDDGTCEWVVIR